MKYDDASWHYGGDFPEELDEAAASTHIGMFVAWCLLNGLAGDIHSKDFPDDFAKLKNKEMTPGEWFIAHCDETFTDEDLNETGNKFAEYYYTSELATFYGDYEKALDGCAPNIYAAPDTWEFYDKLALIIDSVYQEWATRA